jgi:hypothetical protein
LLVRGLYGYRQIHNCGHPEESLSTPTWKRMGVKIGLISVVFKGVNVFEIIADTGE